MIRLLVVDDAPFIREIVRQVLSKEADITIVGEAHDGEQAIERARALKPDVILMDIIMPRLSGIEATREILLHLPDCRIIAFSTADQDIMVVKAMDVGCCSFLEKPFQAEGLIKTIRNSFEWAGERFGGKDV